MANQYRQPLSSKMQSITAKTIRITVICFLTLGLTALVTGLLFYGTALMRQSVREAYNLASHVSFSATRGADSVALAEEVMDIYHGLTDDERQKVGTPEYLSYFEGINTGKGSDHDILFHMLQSFQYDSVDDLYLAMYDNTTCALVYIIDPDQNQIIQTGEWESVSRHELMKFLNWDGEGILYDISLTRAYGMLCTVGVPIRNDAGEISEFILVDISLKKLLPGMAQYALRVLLSLIAITVFIILFLTRRIGKTIVRPINAIAAAASSYSEDHKNGKITADRFLTLDIHTGDELEALRLALADMEQDLAKYDEDLIRIVSEKEHISTELEMARTMQESQLPRTFPAFPERSDFDIYASMDPARMVGGDFYDFYLLDDTHLCLEIADVAGKGIPAALFMMIARILIKNQMLSGETPGSALCHVNNQLLDTTETGMFVTVWLCILDLSTGKGIAANAGHEHPVLRRADNQYEFVKYKHSPAVGTIEDMRFREHEFQLYPGDSLFVYTDGVPEAADAENQLFGSRRLLDALNIDPDASPCQVLTNVRTAIDSFVKDAEQFDDLTMLCITYDPVNSARLSEN